MIGRTNTGGGGTGGILTVIAPAGVTVEVSKDGKTKRKTANAEGFAVFKGLASGTWTLTITDGVQTATKSVEVTTSYNAVISFNTIPEFTYDGDFEIVNDSDEPIAVSQDDWKIRFLTSGALIFTNLNGASDGIDVFCVGGGGGVGSNYAAGAGGGYTKTEFGVKVQVGELYTIAVGAGGSISGDDGGATSAFSNTANGGGGVKTGSMNGGNGGSGGGSYSASVGGNGGSDGSNGTGSQGKPGEGQGTSTREFGETGRTLYAGGGGGGAVSVGSVGKGGDGGGANGMESAEPNTGGGAGGGIDGASSGRNGGSGIVIIRNKR